MITHFSLVGLFLISFQSVFADETKLHSKFERWAENEQAEIESISTLVKFGTFLQNALAQVTGMPVKRGAHAKGTCSAVSLTVEDFSDTKYDAVRSKLHQFDFYKNPEPVYSGVARLSNGSPRTQADTVADARGMAIEIQNAKGVVQDFIMINHPVFFTNNAADYLAFQKLASKAASGKPEDLLAMKAFLEGHPKLAQVVGSIQAKKVSSYLSTQYWTGHAYKFGEEDVVKYSAIPCKGEVTGVPQGATANYLQEDFKNQVSKPEGVCYELHIQFAEGTLDEVQTIVEDPTIELLTPTHKIATVSLQGPVMADDACEAITFNPVHRTFPGMEGIGSIARIRGAVYKASVRTRSVN